MRVGEAAESGEPRAGVRQRIAGGPGDGTDLLFAHNPRPMWIYDAQTLRFLEINDAALAAYGYSRERFLSMTITDIHPVDELSRAEVDLSTTPSGIHRSGPWKYRRSDGSAIEVEIVSQELLYGDRPAYLVVVEDVTERNRLQERVRKLEMSDPVTGLPNRGGLLTEVDRWISSVVPSTALCMVEVDPDGLARVNSRFGYEAGDRLLRRIGEVLAELGPELIVAGRVGGDELVAAVAMPTGDKGAAAVAQHLILAIGEALERDLPVSVTCGVASAMAGQTNAESLLRDAAVAKAWAKLHRRGRFALVEEALGATGLESRLQAAIGAGELVTHFQPILSVAEGQLVGAEALVRWDRPGVGLVPPGEFIPVAEESGLIGEVWRWIVQDALRSLVAWQKLSGFPLSVSLNLSAKQFSDPGTVDHFVATIDSLSLDPGDVVVEVTETAAVNDPDRMHEVISAFRLLNVRIALDDFGTGYSTLAQLERTPFDSLKIDRSFISRVCTDRRQQSIVAGMVRLAHGLGMTVVAEGVETGAQLEQLESLGVDLAQGYYLGRPVPAEAFEARLLAVGNSR